MTITQKQCLLKYLGYYEGKVDGINGNLTEGAQQAFREANGMPALGAELDEVLVGAVFHGKFKQNATEQPKTQPVKENATGDAWSNIKYFKRSEFACKCGGKYCNGFPVEVDKTLLAAADKVREHFGVPVRVSSGVRCNRHNANVGGVSNSRHKTGKAMDFCVTGRTANTVLNYVKKLPEIRYAYAIDGSYVHMDVN